jgi:hypothetical protein
MLKIAAHAQRYVCVQYIHDFKIDYKRSVWNLISVSGLNTSVFIYLFIYLSI